MERIVLICASLAVFQVALASDTHDIGGAVLNQGAPVHLPTRHTFSELHNPVGIPVPQPVPYPVPRPYPVPIGILVPFDRPRPVPVAVPHPVAHFVPRPVAVPVDRPFPYPVPQPVPVTVTQAVAVPVPRPYAVDVPAPVPVRVPYPVPVEQPIRVVAPPAGVAAGTTAYSAYGVQEGVIESHGHFIRHPSVLYNNGWRGI